MSKKQISINMIANIISFTVGFGISFLFTPYLVRTIGKEAYGFYPLANNFTSYAQLLVIALNSMASRFVTIKIVENKEEEANQYFSSLFFANIIIAAILSIFSFILIENINSLLKIPISILSDVSMLFTLIFISMILSIIISVFSIATFARNRLDLRSYQEILLAIIRVSSLFVLFYFFKPQVYYIGLGNLIVTIFTFIITYYYTKKLLPEIKICLNNFRFGIIKLLVSSGIWNSFNQLSAILLSGLDILIANTMLGPAVSGEYGIAQTIPNFIRSLAVVVAGVFSPQLTIIYAKGNKEKFVSEIMKAIKITNIISNVPMAFLIAFGDTFFKLWIPGEDAKKLQLISMWIVLPMMVVGTVNVLFDICTILNKVKIPSIVVFITGLTNIIIVIVLLKTTNLGIFAIPLSSGVLSLIRYLVFTTVYTSKAIGIKWYAFYGSIFRGIFSICIMVFVGYILKGIFLINNWLVFIVVSTLFCFIAMVINVVFFFNKDEIKKGKIMILSLGNRIKR